MKSNLSERGFCLNKTWYWVVTCVVLMLCSSVRAEPKAAKRPLVTRWAKSVSPRSVHPKYPRPQMVRRNWLNLNGLWEYAIGAKDEKKPEIFDGQILVPFPVESALSGVGKAVGEKRRLWYRRTFEVPGEWSQQRVLLHFGAVDWETVVWVNGKKVGSHRGGYDAFTFDITDALKRRSIQEIVLSVWDPTDTGYQPRGKQVRKPGGIWYTSVTGIWQSVWLEPVPETYIDTIRIISDIDNSVVQITVDIIGDIDQCHIGVVIGEGNHSYVTGDAAEHNKFKIEITEPKLWSPDSPFLYELKVMLVKNREIYDKVSSYFGMRKIALGRDDSGVTRIFLNNEPLFMFGPLDQGFWPDGLYTAPTDEAIRYDIEVTKQLGFNMARKHVKVEPARWYYWCDKMGLLVWQDMPSGDRYIGRRDPDLVRGDESARQFELELKHIIEGLGNHPSVVMWVAFNEGWGQYDTKGIVELIRRYDSTRLVNNTSGWADRGVGDVHDIHSYPGPAAPPNELNRAVVLGEFGGLGLPVKGHTWQDEKNWGYRNFKTNQELTEAYLGLLRNLQPLIEAGLSAAVYTQTSDVEIEVNGLMTYDRAMVKMDAKRIADANRKIVSRQ